MHRTRKSYFTLEANFEKILKERNAIPIEVKTILKEICHRFFELYNSGKSNGESKKGQLYRERELEIFLKQLENERKSRQITLVRDFFNQIDREIEREEESGRNVSVQEELLGARNKKESIKNIANQLGEGINPNTIQLLKRFLRQIHSRQRYFLLEQDTPISVIDRMDNEIHESIETLEQNFNVKIEKAYEDDNNQFVRELLDAFESYLKSKETYLKYHAPGDQNQQYRETLKVAGTSIIRTGGYSEKDTSGQSTKDEEVPEN